MIVFFLQRGRDSNPRYAFGAYTLSKRAPSTTRPPLFTLIYNQPQLTKKNVSLKILKQQKYRVRFWF